MRRKKKGIVIEHEPRIDPRERHRTSHKPTGPLGFARTTSETTEEPSRLPVRGAGYPDRKNDLSAANRSYRKAPMARTGRRGRKRRD